MELFSIGEPTYSHTNWHEKHARQEMCKIQPLEKTDKLKISRYITLYMHIGQFNRQGHTTQADWEVTHTQTVKCNRQTVILQKQTGKCNRQTDCHTTEGDWQV